MWMYLAISIAAALSIAFVMLGLFGNQGDTELSQRLDVYLSTGDPSQMVTLKELELSRPFSERVVIPIAQKVAGLFLWMLPQNLYSSLRQRLILAGSPGGIQPSAFVGIKGLMMTISLVVALVFGYLSHYPVSFISILMLLMLALCTFMLPDFWLSRQITMRQQHIVNFLPDALDMLVIANDAGLSFESSVQEITTKWDNVLTREMRKLLSDMRMGVPRREALIGLSERTGVFDINTFVSAVNQAESMGVSIGRVLTVQAEELRVKRRQRAQERANQAPVKMMFPLVFLIFPALFAVLLGPAVPELLATFGGL